MKGGRSHSLLVLSSLPARRTTYKQAVRPVGVFPLQDITCDEYQSTFERNTSCWFSSEQSLTQLLTKTPASDTDSESSDIFNVSTGSTMCSPHNPRYMICGDGRPLTRKFCGVPDPADTNNATGIDPCARAQRASQWRGVIVYCDTLSGEVSTSAHLLCPDCRAPKVAPSTQPTGARASTQVNKSQLQPAFRSGLRTWPSRRIAVS